MKLSTFLKAALAPILIFAITATAVNAQQTNPNNGINWPQATGAGAPTASCTSTNHGQPYIDITANVQYVCGSAGWTPVSGIASAITALTGDVTAAGPGSAAATLKTVNSAPGVCGDATHFCVPTINLKGLVTAQSPFALPTTDWGSPGAIGATTPNSGVFTTLEAAPAGSTAFSATSAGNFLSEPVTLTPLTPATSGANYEAPTLNILGTYWDGSVSQNDVWSAHSYLGSGPNPTSQLVISHAGSSGVSGLYLPANTYVNATSVCLSNGTNCPATNWASPGAIGSTTPNSGALTTLSASGEITANGGLEVYGHFLLVQDAPLEIGGSLVGGYWGPNGGASLYIEAMALTDTTSSGSQGGLPANTILAPVINATNPTTYSSASTLYIGGAPIPGTNATITNPFSLNVAGGATYLGGPLTVVGPTAALPATTTVNGTSVCLSTGVNCPTTITSITSTVGPTNTPFASPSVTSTVLTSVPESRIVRSRPLNFNQGQVVVLYGSSVCAGQGASTYANSWAGLLSAALTAKGYTVYNMSIPGNSTTDLINRFYTDVAPLNPNIVLNCSGLINDTYNADQFRTDLLQLLRMERDLGAIPIVATQYANNNYTAQNYADARFLMKFFDQLGVEAIDLWGCADSSGHYLNAALVNSDGIHPTDACQAIMFSEIPVKMFDSAHDSVSRPPSHRNSWTLSATSSLAPISITPDTQPKSWTIAEWVKDAGVQNISWLGINTTTDGNIRINDSNLASYNINLATSANATLLTSAVSGTTSVWHHVALTFNNYLNQYALYIDGALIGTATNPAAAGTLASVILMGNPNVTGSAMVGASITDVAIYRTALSGDDVQALYLGEPICRSLVWASRFNFAPTAGTSSVSVPGYAWSTSSAVVTNGTFVLAKPPAQPVQ